MSTGGIRTKRFIKYSAPVFIFYVAGDILTTLYALQAGGVEANPYMTLITANPVLFFAVKMGIFPALWFLYRTNLSWKVRNVYRTIPTLAGFLLCVNNVFAGAFQVYLIESIF